MKRAAGFLRGWILYKELLRVSDETIEVLGGWLVKSEKLNYIVIKRGGCLGVLVSPKRVS